jgi:hypothetical protein
MEYNLFLKYFDEISGDFEGYKLYHKMKLQQNALQFRKKVLPFSTKIFFATF